MNALINREILNQTSFDSGALGGLSIVAHRFDQPALYAVTVRQKDAVISRMQLKVSVLTPGASVIDDAKRAQASTGDSPSATDASENVEIDLQSMENADAPSHALELAKRIVADAANGYVSFRAPDGQRDYSVIAETPGRPPFDSRKLDKGDVFAVTLLRPGEYRVANALTGATGTITVAYPVRGATPYSPPEPATVICDAGGFHPSPLALQPAQGVIFQIGAPGRITIDLVKPDDGPTPQPEGTRLPRATWRKRAAER